MDRRDIEIRLVHFVLADLILRVLERLRRGPWKLLFVMRR
jgi:hypothetical protein